MKRIEWNDSYKTGIDTIDNQHKGLFDLINQLSKELDENLEKKLLEKTIEKLFDYTKYHFSTEEYLMRKVNYERYEEHKEAHERFASKVKEFIVNFIDDKENLTEDIIVFLIDWISNHIAKVDKEYIPYIK
ncbi:MAG: bacteriohemerythrin [bacterium]|nr:bacteriohemerythrin [bacterium]